jgi:thiol-disulfide isomerase/thioredoxin
VRFAPVALAAPVVLAALATLVLGGCDPGADKPAPAPASRTDGAKVSAGQAATTEAFCDLHATDAKAAAFRWPELAAGSSAPRAPTTWRWVNVWATWCKPCIEEMPRLAALRAKLAAAGKPVELTFVSVDDSDAEVAAFRAAHPDTPPSIRIAGADKRTTWLKGFGLDDGAIPIHLFVSPANRLRCARAGGIRDKDYAVIEQLLGE